MPHVANVERVSFGLGDQRGLESQFAPDQHPQQGCQRHDSEPADLDETQIHKLPERRPIGRSVHGDEPGDAPLTRS